MIIFAENYRYEIDLFENGEKHVYFNGSGHGVLRSLAGVCIKKVPRGEAFLPFATPKQRFSSPRHSDHTRGPARACIGVKLQYRCFIVFGSGKSIVSPLPEPFENVTEESI